MSTKKVAVIGGGPGGYVAAIRAAQLGGQVTLIEKKKLGGTCLNVGCIPTKSLLHAAAVMTEAREATALGLKIKVEGVYWSEVQASKEAMVKRLVGGVTGLLKANGVNVIQGEASFEAPNQLSVGRPDGDQEKIVADRVIIASGSVPVTPPIDGLAEVAACIDSSGALALTKVPESLLVIGGGVVGLELASIYQTFGSRVTVIEALPTILPTMDGELAVMLRKRLASRGFEILTEARVMKLDSSQVGAAATVEHDGQSKTFEAEKILVAVGRQADTVSLGLDRIGLRHDRGRIIVDGQMKTSLPGIYAVGDCLGQVMLAHVASAQGEVAAENAMGYESFYDGKTNPSCVYTSPEFAGVGLTEEAAKAAGAGLDYLVGRFPLAANGKALIDNGGQGMVKVLAGRRYREILGVHILGSRATDLIAEAALAIRLEATVDELISTIHAHPTVAEAVREAVLAVDGRAIHMTK